MRAAREGHLPVVEYLVERGADMEATDEVKNCHVVDVNHPYVTHELMCVNASGWMDSIDICCKEWQFPNG